MNTTVQTRSVSLNGYAPVQPQRVLQISGLPVPVRIAWNTPRQLWAFAAAIVAASTLFCFASIHAVTKSREAITSVSVSCAPSIVAAQQVRAWLADYDANQSNLLLCDPASKEGKQAAKDAQGRHRQIAQTLVEAATHITFGDSERIPINTLVDGFASYEALMTKAQALQGKGDTASALAISRDANALMQQTIIPAAETLDRVNSTELDSVYRRQRFDAQGAIAILIVTGLITIGLLVSAQFYLMRKTRRILNPALLAATTIALFQLGNSTIQNLHAAHQLRVAVDDAFGSVHALWKARATGFDANSEESRYLFDRAHAATADRAFFEKTKEIASIPPGMNVDTITRMVRSESTLPGSFTGHLADEMHNLTFPGEREAAIDALETFERYVAIDSKIRRFEKDGAHTEAVRLCLSFDAGGSNSAFDDYDHALDRVIAINQGAFDNACQSSLSTLARGEWTIGIATLLAIAGTLVGIWPRIREYYV